VTAAPATDVLSVAWFHYWATLAELALAAATFLALWLVTAPYGRHNRAGWGPNIPSRVGWVVMESVAVLVFAAVFFLGRFRFDPLPLAFLFLFQLHYVNRAVIYPLRTRNDGTGMPLVIVLLAVLFNSLNGYVNARWVSHIGVYGISWLYDPRFLVGVAMFFVGRSINLRADATLRALRKPGDKGYKIPRGGLYEQISCPNYFGEILEWTGWAIATWSWAGAAFAIYTFANLAPRAWSNHLWYRETFPDYPQERRALIPWLF